jgi:polyhydroxyalkanoate synthesis regulator phasin
MASRRLRNRSYSVVTQGDSDNRENMEDSNVTCFESDAEVTVGENPALEQAEQNANIIVTSNDNVTIITDSNVDKGSMSASQLQELLSILMQTIRCESCKQTAALVATMDSKLTSAIENLKSEFRYENEKLAENLIARFESVNVEIREELNAKLS